MTFEEFQKTRRTAVPWAAPCHMLDTMNDKTDAFLIYENGFYIERFKDGSYWLLLERDEFTATDEHGLECLERRLYTWGKLEGCFDAEPAEPTNDEIIKAFAAIDFDVFGTGGGCEGLFHRNLKDRSHIEVGVTDGDSGLTFNTEPAQIFVSVYNQYTGDCCAEPFPSKEFKISELQEAVDYAADAHEWAIREGREKSLHDLAAAMMCVRPELEPMSLDEWIAEHSERLNPAEYQAAYSILKLFPEYGG